MTRTLTACSSLLAAFGVLVTLLCFSDAKSWLPLGVLTYVFYALAAWSAARLATQAIVLTLTLSSGCIGFWCFWEARLSPWNTSLMPSMVVMIEYLVAGTVWFVIRRLDRTTIPRPNNSSATNRRSARDSRGSRSRKVSLLYRMFVSPTIY